MSVANSLGPTEQAPFSLGTRAPKLKVQANSCDCHMHVYDHRYPPAAGATLFPPDASITDYRLLQRRLGTSRTVVVTPSTYGTDNGCTMQAIAEHGPEARGVVVVDAGTTVEELKSMHRAGARGIRFQLARGTTTNPESIEPLAHRVRSLGWHVQVLAPADVLVQMECLLQRLSTPIVFDHMGRIPATDGLAHPAYRMIRRLLDQGNAWVKLSGAYLISATGAPGYTDAAALARAYVNAAPERMLWGSDWPHAVATAGERPLPDDADLLDLLIDCTPNESVCKKILVDNPAELYGF